ncbi:MAG TPA: hypothetical protein VNH13_02315 [Candidatus Acidoferrales bacterium]|jgi:hypothetical protein|nr:hypothetical protein [Candidatus Acidoferrales bacterium]
MKELIAEFLLRGAKVLAAAIIGAIVYLVLTGPLGADASPTLALLSFVAGGVVLLLFESSPI